MSALVPPELVFHDLPALAEARRHHILFEFASGEDMERGAGLLAEALGVFVRGGAMGGYAIPDHRRIESTMATEPIVREGDREAGAPLQAANIDAKAFQLLRNMLGALVAGGSRLQRIRLRALDGVPSPTSPARLPPVDVLNESAAYPATAASDVFDLVWSDSQFSKARRVMVEFRDAPPPDLPERLEPYVQAWFALLERGAFCAPFGLPFEVESIGGRLTLFDSHTYEISISRYMASEAGFRILANLLARFSQREMAISRIEID